MPEKREEFAESGRRFERFLCHGTGPRWVITTTIKVKGKGKFVPVFD
jgi:hypothetical protein